MKKIISIILISLVMSSTSLSALDTPVGLCINNVNCNNTTAESGLLPGTNLKFYPGFFIAATENLSPEATEAKWQALFTEEKNRKETYRPPGIYGGIVRRLAWWRFYHRKTIIAGKEQWETAAGQWATSQRPKNPRDHTDPAYNWKPLDDIFTINAVENEGALVLIGVMEVGYGSGSRAPKWLENSPYNGIFESIKVKSNGDILKRVMPRYHRYSGPDLRLNEDVNAHLGPPIVDEFVDFQYAMREHLIAKGYIDKVMGIQTSEFYGGGRSGYEVDYYHGVGTRAKQLAELWAQSQIPVYQSSIGGGKTMTTILAQYVRATQFGITHPDVKLERTNELYTGRFSIDGINQQNFRHLIQATESNGMKEYTTFTSGVTNPWGYSNNEKVKQTASHVLWALSGDSCDGSNTPKGLMPVHNIILVWDSNLKKDITPSVTDWHDAIDAFGPPGTGSFPYLPKAYRDQWSNLNCKN